MTSKPNPREILQRAWDRIDSLPPIDFTDDEADAIIRAISPPRPVMLFNNRKARRRREAQNRNPANG